MTKMCCMSLTTGAKLIGTFGLSLSILIINMLLSNFFSTQEEQFVIAVESWMLFGLNWSYVTKSLKVAETARTMLTCVLIYSTLSLIANALLVLGSLLKKPTYVLPWMYMQMISIIDQTLALVIQLTQEEKSDPLDTKSVLYIPACSVYLLISSYFWMTVSSARCEWLLNEENEFDEYTSTRTTSSQTSIDSNMPKTPSFLSSNIALVYDHPASTPPPKYEVV